MELLSQKNKALMEECKVRAKKYGLNFPNETLEYIVSNQDMIKLSPKIMIPSMYDYWVHDIQTISGKAQYDVYPHNPYETVINTRPPISFYNDNNTLWMNIFIFYHVLGHIDFFNNNIFYKNTWDIDFTAQALTDKRIISKLRSKHGRWVDYIIEFTRAIDNLVDYQKKLFYNKNKLTKLDFYFDIFLQKIEKISYTEYNKELKRYNKEKDKFFNKVNVKYPEFESLYEKELKKTDKQEYDVLDFILKNSSYINKEENQWMKTIIKIIKNTSMYFQPQIRTKIMNEGWASYWHEKLFMDDERINRHETDFSIVNAKVTSLPKVGLNPYAIGLRLFKHIKEMEDKGCYSLDYMLLNDNEKKKNFNNNKNTGDDYIFNVRSNYDDFTFINKFVDQEFMDKHNLFVAGRELDPMKRVYRYYIKSKKLEDYKKMLTDSLYHPPVINVNTEKTNDEVLYLNHKFEDKPLKKDWIYPVMMGLEFLWGNEIKLETSEVISETASTQNIFNFWQISTNKKKEPKETKWERVVYSLKKKKFTRIKIKGK